MNYRIIVGKNITRIRKKRGMTISELGYECDIEKSNLIPIEKGRINVTIDTLTKIAKALGVPLVEFFKEN